MTTGLAFPVAILQTACYRTDSPDQERMTRFFGTLLLLNVAAGVVTGLVKEFEFGMSSSTYSRDVGGVFGARLAMEGLAAFFLDRRSWDSGFMRGLGPALVAMLSAMAARWQRVQEVAARTRYQRRRGPRGRGRTAARGLTVALGKMTGR